MLEIIIAAGIGAASHLKSKDFVRRRLRYTNLVEKPGIGLMSGAVAAIAAAPLVAVLPVVGTVTAVVFGAAVGTGVSVGAHQARRGLLPEE